MTTLEKRLSEKSKEALALLVDLVELVEDTTEPESGAPSWGHVANLGYAIETLTELKQFLSR